MRQEVERSFKAPVLVVTRGYLSTIGMIIQTSVNQGIADFLVILTKKRSSKVPILAITRDDHSAVRITIHVFVPA
ncbi:MAG TPA: hypothetical protein DCS93_31040 [Microscillaceae bacterium]|nr:hypothetical protein [Microscillaceae bacterium]